MNDVLKLLSWLPQALERYPYGYMPIYVESFVRACDRAFGPPGALLGYVGPFGLAAILLTVAVLARASARHWGRKAPGPFVSFLPLLLSGCWYFFWLSGNAATRFDLERYTVLTINITVIVIDGIIWLRALTRTRKERASTADRGAPSDIQLPPGVTMDDLRQVLEQLEAEEKGTGEHQQGPQA